MPETDPTVVTHEGHCCRIQTGYALGPVLAAATCCCPLRRYLRRALGKLPLAADGHGLGRAAARVQPTKDEEEGRTTARKKKSTRVLLSEFKFMPNTNSWDFGQVWALPTWAPVVIDFWTR
ncbi:hypothetical protein PG996_015989 [Apiospora saccharicola]|uniref:Uncharacterized protein n=1 Tax=Apiospora saccharicola TaxID=335842 RepID=A0ABR1TMP9_9PEZI